MITFLLYLVGMVNIGLSFPVEGPLGAVLGLVGMASIWVGWRRATRRSRGGAR